MDGVGLEKHYFHGVQLLPLVLFLLKFYPKVLLTFRLKPLHMYDLMSIIHLRTRLNLLQDPFFKRHSFVVIHMSFRRKLKAEAAEQKHRKKKYEFFMENQGNQIFITALLQLHV